MCHRFLILLKKDKIVYRLRQKHSITYVLIYLTEKVLNIWMLVNTVVLFNLNFRRYFIMQITTYYSKKLKLYGIRGICNR